MAEYPLLIFPEQALVLETVGSIENFINAVKKVKGLEWLGEVEINDLDPIHGFENKNDSQKLLRGQLFLVMTDQRALQELQSLFNRWKQNQKVTFPRGLAPLKNAFVHLHSIRPWDAQDRIRETGIIEDWQFRMKHGQQTVPFEAELWFRENPDRRRQAESYLRNVIQGIGGEIVHQCVVPEIAYHCILGKIPQKQVPEIIAQREVRLLQCEDIMHLRPVGQCAILFPGALSDTKSFEKKLPSEVPRGEPIIGLFDGLPLTGHNLLDGRLIVDDPDGYENAYQAQQRVHGTAMASLICHGDLEQGNVPAKRPVYVRPIMQPRRT